jgi:predicted DNA-binding transcriptional regulator YafY
MKIEKLRFVYRNWKGNYSERRVIPVKMEYAKSIYHQELGESWFLVAQDEDKKDIRYFAMVDIIKFL